MTLNEFKMWLDGFSEAMGDAPTPEQWAKIKTKLAETWAEVLPVAPYVPSMPSYPSIPANPLPWGPTWTCGPNIALCDLKATSHMQN